MLCKTQVLDRLAAGVGAVAFAGGQPAVVHPAPVLADYARRDGLRVQVGGRTARLGPVVKVLLVNDRPGLAGLAAVPADANPGIRDLADLVVGRCEDGAVADLVAHLLGPDGSAADDTVTAAAAAPTPTYARRAGPAGKEIR